MAAAGPSQRRPVVGEVIMEFADGSGTYVKAKLEDNVLAVERRKIEKDQARKKAALEAALKNKESGPAKRTFTEDDIQSIITELGTTRAEAEEALRKSNGNLEEALGELVSPTGVKIGWQTRT